MEGVRTADIGDVEVAVVVEVEVDVTVSRTVVVMVEIESAVGGRQPMNEELQVALDVLQEGGTPNALQLWALSVLEQAGEERTAITASGSRSRSWVLIRPWARAWSVSRSGSGSRSMSRSGSRSRSRSLSASQTRLTSASRSRSKLRMRSKSASRSEAI